MRFWGAAEFAPDEISDKLWARLPRSTQFGYYAFRTGTHSLNQHNIILTNLLKLLLTGKPSEGLSQQNEAFDQVVQKYGGMEVHISL